MHYFFYKPAVILGLQYLSKDIKSKAKPSSDSGIGRHRWLSNKIKERTKNTLCHNIVSENMCICQTDSTNLIPPIPPPTPNKKIPIHYLNEPVKLKHSVINTYIHIQTQLTYGLNSLLSHMVLMTSSHHEFVLHAQVPRTTHSSKVRDCRKTPCISFAPH